MKYFEDAAVGDTFGAQSTYRITAEEIKSFATQWDPQRYRFPKSFVPLAGTNRASLK